MQPLDLCRQSRKWLRTVRTAAKDGTRVSEDARHMPDQFLRGPDPVTGLEVGEVVGCVAEGLLGPIGQGGQEVAQDHTLL